MTEKKFSPGDRVLVFDEFETVIADDPRNGTLRGGVETYYVQLENGLKQVVFLEHIALIEKNKRT